MTAATGSRQHRAGEVAADRIIHIMGTLVGVVGSAILVGIAAWSADRPVFYASVVYSFCLLMMLACSAAYNLATDASRRGFLRQLDHAVIFLMIAGTYTPFTSCRASIDRCLPGARLDDSGWDATHARLGRRSDGGFDRSWGPALFCRGRFS